MFVGGDGVKVLDIIKDASKLLGLKDVIDDINNNNYDNEEIEYLVLAVNTVNNNIAANYIELVDSVTLSSYKGLIAFNKLSRYDLLDIKSLVRTSDNKPVEFTLRSDGIHIADGEYKIEYSYFPKNIGIEGTVELYSKVNVRLFSLGVVAEYLFLKGDLDEAYVWDKKFKQNLRGVLRYKKSLVLPERRWL